MDKRQVLRYLRYGGQEPDEAVDQMIDACIREARRRIQPKSVYRIVPCAVCGDTVDAGPLHMPSHSLALCLKDCGRAVVLCATLGVAADQMIREFSVTDMAKAAVCQAVLAQCIEEYLDELTRQIMEEQSISRLRPRFSPGYGDLELAYQRDIFSLLEVPKRIGVTLTDSLLMVPTKSVTALIGIYRD